jgi:lysophospholipase L1-like esterase
MPVGVDQPEVNGQVRALNVLMEQWAAREWRVTICDTWKIFTNANLAADKQDFPDLLHPNEQGYAKLAKALRPMLRDVLALRGARGQEHRKQQ